MSRRLRVAALVAVLAGAGCGIKAPPRPPVAPGAAASEPPCETCPEEGR